MIDTNSASTARLRLPPEKFYWAVLDASAVGGRSGRLRTRLGYLFENVLPEPIEQVHAAYIRVNTASSSPYLACGMSAANLRHEIQEHPEALHLGPATLPAFVTEQLGDSAISVDRLNLLRDEYEPPTVRRMRKRLAWQIATVGLVLAAILAFGFERRVGAMHQQAEAVARSRIQMIADTVGGGGAEGNRQPPDVRLIAELRRLRQSRGSQMVGGGSSITDQESFDCAPILANLLRLWPSDVAMMTDSIVITPTSISIHGSTPSSQDVQTLADSLGGVANDASGGGGGDARVAGRWLLQQPQMNTGRDGVQATLQLNRSGPKGGPS